MRIMTCMVLMEGDLEMTYDNWAVGDTIRYLRKEQHLTQVEMAEKLDISAIHYSQIEQGRHKMSIDLLYKMMTVFCVDANTVLGIKQKATDSGNGTFDAICQRINTFDPVQQEYLLYVFHMLMDKFPTKREERLVI